MFMRREEKEYKQDHAVAKTVMAVYQLVLTILIAVVFVSESLTLLLPLFILKELGYFFGVNTVGYIVEAVRHHKHRHNKI